MKLRNINGTSPNNCPCGSWLAHWTNLVPIGGPPPHCPVQGCPNKPSLGAHVQTGNLFDQSWFIAPLCAAHNAQRGATLDVEPVFLAPANVSETCGKHR